MEFVTHGSSGRLDADAKQKVRAAAMRTYRQRQRQSRHAKDALLKDSLKAKKVTLENVPPSDIKALATKHLDKVMQQEGISLLAQKPSIWYNEPWGPGEVNLMSGLFGSYYGYLGHNSDGASHGISIAWSAAPSPMLLSSLVLSTYGTMMVVNEDLPLDIGYRYKDVVLKELSLRANAPAAFFSGPVMLTLLSLCSYEQSIMSDEAHFHLGALRQVIDAKGGVKGGGVTHCHHIYLAVDISDIALATWRNEIPILSDLKSEATPSRSLEIHLSALAAALTAEIYALNDEHDTVRKTLQGVPKVLMQAQMCLNSTMVATTDRACFEQANTFNKQLEEFLEQACLSYHKEQGLDDAQLIGIAFHRCMAILCRLSTSAELFDSNGLDIYAADVQDCISRISAESWNLLPFMAFYVFLTAGLVLRENSKKSRCKAVLTRTLHTVTVPNWLKLRSFTISFYHIIRALRRQSDHDSQTRKKSYSVTTRSHGVHPKLQTRMDADMKFYTTGESGGHWTTLNKKLGALLLLE